MRHKKKKKRLGRTTSHRKATMRNLARSLFCHQSIRTTKVKAKEVRGVVDKLITIAKKDTPYHQRLVFSIIPDKKLIKELFKEIAPRFKSRAGGYTRIIPVNFRRGDGADMVILELTEKKIIEKPKAKPKKALAKEAPAEKKIPLKTEEGPQETKIALKPKTMVAEEIAKEKAKREEKKIQKSFFKGLRRFFRGKAP